MSTPVQTYTHSVKAYDGIEVGVLTISGTSSAFDIEQQQTIRDNWSGVLRTFRARQGANLSFMAASSLLASKTIEVVRNDSDCVQVFIGTMYLGGEDAEVKAALKLAADSKTQEDDAQGPS